MDSPPEFIERTESAVQHLFSGIDEYMAILRQSSVGVVFSGTFGSDEAYRQALEQWQRDNEAKIKRSLAAQREFSAERFALGVLCGSVLQVAETAIRMYSANTKAAPAIVGKDGGVAAKFSIGREVRGVPIGLIIYAGRNQYNHMDDGKLREPNVAVFEALATNHGCGVHVKDPAFDVNNDLVLNYSSNITHLLGWRDYESYVRDLRALLNI